MAYHDDADEAARRALRWWPNALVPGELIQQLPTPAHFEQALQRADVDDIAAAVVCGPDPEVHARALRTYREHGFTHVAVNQVIPGVDGVFDFYRDEVLPRL